MNGCLNTGRDALYRQGNNVVEKMDGPTLTQCNVTAIAMAWAAVTKDFDNWKNPFGGPYRWQPEDLVYFYLHDERLWDRFQEERRKTSSAVRFCHEQPHDGMWPPEQIPQLHQFPLREIFRCGSDFSYAASFTHVAGETTRGVSCILRLIDPGHFITAVKYDAEKMLIGFKDPAPVRWLNNTEDADGNKWMSPKDFKDNIHTDITRAWRY